MLGWWRRDGGRKFGCREMVFGGVVGYESTGEGGRGGVGWVGVVVVVVAVVTE